MDNSKSEGRARPLSPHLQIWRWHITMATSIFHRASGIANIFGLFLLLYFLGALVSGEAAFDNFKALVKTPIGQVILFGILVSNSYHIVNGIRHLLFNAGIGLDKNTASKTAWLVIIFGILGGIIMYLLGLWALGN